MQTCTSNETFNRTISGKWERVACNWLFVRLPQICTGPRVLEGFLAIIFFITYTDLYFVTPFWDWQNYLQNRLGSSAGQFASKNIYQNKGLNRQS